MKKVFQDVKGNVFKYDNIVPYILDILTKDPMVKIHIGTDSQNHTTTTSYATVIAFHMKGGLNGGGQGVHCLYQKQKFNKIKDKYIRLFKEAEMSIEVANWLTDLINIKVEIDLDYNNDKKFFSSKLVESTRGWAISEGYKVNIKPGAQIATRFADYLCK